MPDGSDVFEKLRHHSPSSLTAAPWASLDLSLAERHALLPPDWPGSLFPSLWQDFIKRAAEARGCPPDFIGMALLIAICARIGNARRGSPWGDWREPTALWAVAVGHPSSGKSAGLDEAGDALSALEAEMNGDIEERLRQYRTDKAEAREVRERWDAEVKKAVKLGNAPPLEPLAAREPDSPALRRAMTTETTTEKAGRLAAQNPRGLLLLRDELAGWIGSMDRYGGGAGADRGFWLQSYGGRRWTPDRVKDGDNPVVVPHLTWGILGSIQPDRVASLLLSGDDDGLTARFLYAWPAPRAVTRPTTAPPTGILLTMLRRLDALPWTPPEPVILPFTSQAADAMQEWREQTSRWEAEASGLLHSWIGKLPGFALRLAVVFEHLQWLDGPSHVMPPVSVGEEAFKRACRFLADYSLPMARRVFGEAAVPEAERDARRLARWYLRQNPRPETLNARDLRRRAGRPEIPTAERLDTALAELAAAGWCRSAPVRAGESYGRPRKDWQMNPALAKVSAP